MRSLALLLATVAVAACGTTRERPAAITATGVPAPAAAAAKAHGAPLLMYFDGKDSCRKLPSLDAVLAGDFGRWDQRFGEAVAAAAAQSGALPDFLLACLPLLGQPGRVTYYAVGAAGSTAYAGSASPEEFVRVVTQAAAAATGEVFIAGHSYGGWLAMRAVALLPPAVRVSTLLTIDPISPVGCTPLKGIADYLRHGVPARCNEAPADITAAERQRVRGRTGRWLNYFETANAYLHASAIAEAGANVEVPFAAVGVLAGLASENNPHLYIATAAATWAEFLTGP